MKRSVSLFLAGLLALSVLLFCAAAPAYIGASTSVTLEAKAYAVGDTVSDGVIVASDISYCGCCHAHNHDSSFGGRISCIICKIKQAISKLFGGGEGNVQHKYQIVSNRAATCTAEGATVLRCGVCSKSLTLTSAKLAHSPVSVPAKAATCTSTGLTAGSKCSVCGTVLTAQTVTPALGHSFGAYTSNGDAACTADGTKSAVCSRCGVRDTVADVGSKLGHSYSSAVTAPTCTAQGYTQYTCTRCGDTYNDNYTNALGHDFGNWAEVQPASCTAEGTEKRSCSRCDAFETRAIASLGHDFGAWAVTLDPGCETDGSEKRSCSRCDVSETRPIEALGHDYDAQTIAPTCTENGYTVHTCARCSDSYTDGVTAALGHDFGAWADVTSATCTAAGEQRRDCSRCDASETQVVNALGHDYNTVVIAPTCMEQGYTSHTCTRCGDSFTENETSALGHSYGNWSVDVAPTCTSTGTEKRTCIRCDAYETRTLAALSHDFADGATVENLTVSANSNTVIADYICRYCGELIENAEIDAAASLNGYSVVYHTLQGAMSFASGKTVYLLRDYTLTEPLTINAGATLVIPCMDNDAGYTAEKDSDHDDGSYPHYCPDNPGTTIAPALYRTLTIPQGVTVDVKGTLLINAVTGGAQGGFADYGITGGYAAIALGGEINVSSGGIMDCSGYVYDNGGSVLVVSGGKFYETYGVTRWRGGSYAYATAMVGSRPSFPIQNYDFNFMQAKLTVQYGALYAGNVKMYGTPPGGEASYYYCHFPVISINSNALYLLLNGARCERTVTAGKPVYKFYGNVKLYRTALTVSGTRMSTDKCGYYIFDGNAQVEFYDGTVTCGYKFHYLPGFKMVVGEGATLNLGKNGCMLFSTADNYTVGDTQYYGFYHYDQQYLDQNKWYTPGRDDAALYILDGGAVTVQGTGSGVNSIAAIAGHVYKDGESSFICEADNEKTFDTITRYVPKGAVLNSGIDATIESNDYVTVLLHSVLDAAAEAEAKTMLGLE